MRPNQWLHVQPKPTTYKIARAEYLAALEWNGEVWRSGDAEVNPSYELQADGYLLAALGQRAQPYAIHRPCE